MVDVSVATRLVLQGGKLGLRVILNEVSLVPQVLQVWKAWFKVIDRECSKKPIPPTLIKSPYSSNPNPNPHLQHSVASGVAGED
jgi:hypothetical protein